MLFKNFTIKYSANFEIFKFDQNQMEDNLYSRAASIQNYKMVDQKYFIKNYRLGKGNFAETYNFKIKVILPLLKMMKSNC